MWRAGVSPCSAGRAAVSEGPWTSGAPAIWRNLWSLSSPTVTVDVFEPVLDGQEPQRAGTRPTLSAVARTDPAAAKDTAYVALDAVRLRCLAENAPATDAATHVPALLLKARGAPLGVVAFARSRHAGPFEHEEIQLAEEVVSRTAVCLDNARRHTREHATALTLQRDLLPRALPQQPGVEVAHRCLPAAGPAGVGGDWYDVIPSPGHASGWWWGTSPDAARARPPPWPRRKEALHQLRPFVGQAQEHQPPVGGMVCSLHKPSSFQRPGNFPTSGQPP